MRCRNWQSVVNRTPSDYTLNFKGTVAFDGLTVDP